LVPVAVKVTPVPEQTELDDTTMETDGKLLAVTVKVVPVAVAVVPERHVGILPPTSNVAETTSLLDGK
jgi:hypothetical protein